MKIKALEVKENSERRRTRLSVQDEIRPLTSVQQSSAGAVPAALHTVEDLLLQLLALLLSLRQALGCRLGPARAARVSVVLCVPQVCVQTARRAQKSLMTAALHHLPLRHEHRERSCCQSPHNSIIQSPSVCKQAQVLLTQAVQIIMI